MRPDTRQRKKAVQALQEGEENQWWMDRMGPVMLGGQPALAAARLDIGRPVAETILDRAREPHAGPDAHPTSPELRKWASQPGSLSVGDQPRPEALPQ
jgi:hypothetical protein